MCDYSALAGCQVELRYVVSMKRMLDFKHTVLKTVLQVGVEGEKV